MATKTKTAPVLSAISAFDAEFSDKNLSVPVLRFTWADGLIKKSRVEIRDYDTDEITYNHTVEKMSMKHEIDSTSETYKLQNGRKYIAAVYVYPDDDEESPKSNEVIFYCFSQPTFEFKNFTNYSDDIAVVETNTVVLKVDYKQIEKEKLNEYQFKILDAMGNTLTASPIKYSNEYDVILRHTFGGVDDTKTDERDNFIKNGEYIAICTGVTAHGIKLYIEQKFVVKSISTGVGALISAENVGDGTVSIVSNYKIMNANCSVDPPTYLIDESGNEYAIDLTNGEYVEFIDGFVMKNPYEIIFKGKFQPGRLVTLKSIDGYSGYISLDDVLDNFPVLSYYSFAIEDLNGENLFKTRTGGWYYDIMVRNETLIFNEENSAYVDSDIVIYQSENNPIEISDDIAVLSDDSGMTKIKLTCNDYVFDLDYINNFAKVVSEEDFENLTDIALAPQASEIIFNDIDYIRVENGIYDDLYSAHIDETTDIDSFEVPDSWTSNTYMHAKFNGNLFSGNADFGVENTTNIIIKRREKGTYEWMPLINIEANDSDDYNFVVTDLYASSGVTYEYASVPIVNGVEIDYVIAECKAEFDRLVVIDSTGIYNTPLDIEISQTKNNTSSTILPIGCKYPIPVYNSSNNYYTGNISATFIPIDEINKKFVTDDISRYRAEVLDFLNNRLVKYIKDPFGRAWLATVGTAIEDADNGHNAAHSLSFDFTEVGDISSNSDMYKFGLLDIEQEWW